MRKEIYRAATQTQKFQAGAGCAQNEVDLATLWWALLEGKWIILSIACLFSVGCVLYVLTLPDKYTSSAILAPVESSAGGLGPMAAQLGGFASLAGINLDQGRTSKTTEAIEILKSWKFIEDFIKEQQIEPEVFAANGWNKLTDTLQYNLDLYDPEKARWVVEGGENENRKPSSWGLYQRFNAFMYINEDPKTGFTTLSVEYYSPKVAQEWVSGLVKRVNRVVRERDAQNAKSNIKFLRERIDMTPVANMQKVFYNLIEDQTKALMLASGTDEYVFRVVSEPRVAEVKSSPKRAVICLMGGGLGLMLGILFGLVFGMRKYSR